MRRNVLMAMAALLFAAGFAVDRLWIQPILDRTQALEVQRKAALAKVGSQAEATAELDVLAEGLGLADLSGLASLAAGIDPVVYIGRCVASSGLRQIELTNDAGEDAGGLHRSRFTLRAQGEYAQFVSLLREMEGGARLVTVDGFTVVPTGGGANLECRVALSIHDPIRKAAS